MSSLWPRSERGKTAALLALACLGLLAALLPRLNAPFYGAMEAQAAAQTLPARNHLRYGLSITRGFNSFAPGGLPADELRHHWWVHHPSLSGLYTAAVFAVFGDSVPVARLSAILVAVLTLPLFWLAGRALDSKAAGWWAVLFYAGAGLSLWESRRPEYFQPCLFLLMAAFVLFLHALERPGWNLWAAAGACLAAAGQIDWMAYPFGAVLATAVLLRRRRQGIAPAAVLAGSLGVSFLAFWLHVTWAVGPEAWGYLKSLLINRISGLSRLDAFRVMAAACVTHVGLAATLGGLAGLFVPGNRWGLWLLGAYGIVASQFFLGWTIYHAYVAAWFMFPFLVLGAALAASRLLPMLKHRPFRLAAAGLLAAAVLGQGAAVAVFRHRQDTWYRPDREVANLIKREIRPMSWVATPLKHMNHPLLVYETDCNFFWGTTSRTELESLLRRSAEVHVLVPKTDSGLGFWAEMSPRARVEYGIRSVDENARQFLAGAPRRDLGAYELFLLRRSQ